MHRREFLKWSTLGGGLLISGLSPRYAFGLERQQDNLLLVVLLNGGADPLTLFPPVEDDTYFQQRPTLAVAKAETRPLTNPFGLNAALSPLYRLWQEGEMAVIHQFGLPTAERSHSGARSLLQKGIDLGQAVPVDGFLSRALAERFGNTKDPMRALAVQNSFPTILSGSAGAVSFASIDELQKSKGGKSDVIRYEKLYLRSADADFRRQGEVIFSSIKKVREVFHQTFAENSNGSGAPPSGLTFQLNEITRIVQANLGLRVAVTSLEGWDSHGGQERLLLPLMQDLGNGLAGFSMDLKKSGHWEKTMVLVMTEFGRSAKQNGAMGSDHGHGSAAILLGGPLKRGIGGKILHNWKSLKSENLSDGRDLPVVHDYRDVFSEVLQLQLGLRDEHLKAVFPGHIYRKVGLFA